MVTAPLLEVTDLFTRFETRDGVVHAVNGVSFEVGEGELVGLVGETGCGKSVTARSIMGLIRPPGKIVSGSVLFDGRDVRALKRGQLRALRGAKIGFIPQNPWGSINPILRIDRQFHNVIREHVSVSRAEASRMALEMLGKVGIAGPDRVLRGYAHELSGGMAQRVVIAIALILNPSLVIADEPTTGLDVTIQRQILDLIMELLERDRRAMLLVTHDLGIVAQYCHRVIVMYAGKVVESGPVRDVFRKPAHPYTEALLGAIPRPGQPLTRLRGSVPSLIDYPVGCPFRMRCDYAFSRCESDAPVLRDLEARRQCSCHLERGVATNVADTA
jgi:oligopeptide/dipeptide ABC transporter ATP-binding protein